MTFFDLGIDALCWIVDLDRIESLLQVDPFYGPIFAPRMADVEAKGLNEEFSAVRRMCLAGNDRFNAAFFCSPYLKLICSETLAPHITLCALQTLEKFLSSGWIARNRVGAHDALRDIIESLHHLRFQQTDPSEAETVFLVGLKVLLRCVCTPAVHSLLTDQLIFKVLRTCFQQVFEANQATQHSLSNLFRVTSEDILLSLVQALMTIPRFSDCQYEFLAFVSTLLHPDHDGQYIQTLGLRLLTTILTAKVDSPPAQRDLALLYYTVASPPVPPSPFPLLPLTPSSSSTVETPSATTARLCEATAPPPSPPSPHLLPFFFHPLVLSGVVLQLFDDVASIGRLAQTCTVLWRRLSHPQFWHALLTHHFPHHLEPDELEWILLFSQRQMFQRRWQMRYGPAAAAGDHSPSSPPPAASPYPSPKIHHHFGLMTNVLRLLSSQTPEVVQMALQIFLDLWRQNHHRHRGFHSHFQVLIQNLFVVIQQQAPTNYMFFRNARHLEIIFEGLYEAIFSSRTRLLELFWHYDAQPFSANLLQSLCLLFAETISRGNAIIMQHPCSIIALDSLFSFLKLLHAGPFHLHLALPFLQAFSLAQLQKSKLLAAVTKFNEMGGSSKSADAFSEVLGDRHQDPRVLAPLLHQALDLSLDKRILARYLGCRTDLVNTLRKQFIGLVPCQDQTLMMAIRILLDKLTLVGLEAQAITRILDTFSEVYLAANPGCLADVASLSTLCHSVVMLNMDRHGSHVKNKMSLDSWCHIHREANAGGEFPRGLLVEIYQSIVEAELKPTTALHIPIQAPPYPVSPALRTPALAVLGPAMLSSLWQPILTSLVSTLTVSADLIILRRAAHGLRLMSDLAATAGLGPIIIDGVLMALNTLLIPTLEASNGCVLFAHSPKNHLATELLVHVVRSHAKHLDVAGWDAFLRFCLAIQHLNLISNHPFHPLPASDTLPLFVPPVAQHSPLAANLRSDSSLFTRLSGWFSGTTVPPSPPASEAHFPPRHHPDHRHPVEDRSACHHTQTFLDKLQLEELFSSFSTDLYPLHPNPLLGALLGFVRNPAVPTPSASSSHHAPRAAPFGHPHHLSLSESHLHVLADHPGDSSEPALALRSSLSSSREPSFSSPLMPPALPLLPFHPDIAVMCLDLLVKVVINLSQVDRSHAAFPHTWYSTGQALLLLLEDKSYPQKAKQAAINSLLTLAINAVDQHRLLDPLAELLTVMVTLHQEMPQILSPDLMLAAARQLLAKDPNVLVHSVAYSQAILSLLKSTTSSSETCLLGFKTLIQILSRPEHISRDNLIAIVQTLRAFAVSETDSSSIPMQAMELLYTVFAQIPHLQPSKHPSPLSSEPIDGCLILLNGPPGRSTAASTQLADDDDRWHHLWLPVLKVLASLCIDRRDDVRNYAMALLQRALLSAEFFPAVETNDEHISDCFSQVLFPLFSEFFSGKFQNHPAPVHPATLEELRLRALTLISKIFLHLWYIPASGHPTPLFQSLWTKILNCIEDFSNIDDSDILAEAIHECLKNILLVMGSSGIFKIPAASTIWSPSFVRIISFCPTLSDIINELLPQMGLPPNSLPGSPSSKTRPLLSSVLQNSLPSLPSSPTSSYLEKRTRSAEVLDM